MSTTKRLLTAAVAALALTVLALPASAASGQWYVNDATGNDANDCETPATACKTIQAAITKASNGDTVNVAAGTYLEPAPGPLTVSKTLTLLGAQAGADARTRAGAESVIADPQGTSVAANGVVIDGFTVQGSVVAAFTGYGIWMNPGFSGTTVVNNIIQNNIVGIGLANSGSTQAVVRHNLIRTNNSPGGASGSGIYTDQFAGGTTVRNVLVEENTFAGHTGGGAAINLSNTSFGTGGVFDLDVTSNTFTTNNRAFVLFNTHDALFDDNTITGSTFAGSADARIFDGNSGLTFTNNDFGSGTGHAARLSALFATPSSDVEFHFNNFENYVLTGLTVDPASHAGTVNAECNWWNSPSGPTSPDNPGGTGEEVVGDADFTPWLVARAPGGPCIGGKPSTPGKVTGGGQIEGEPLFSPLGELISVPAIVPSAVGGTSKATFGLSVRCCPATGNLVYQDHGMGVRIKATAITALFITNGTCGPRTHAQIVGTASVSRSTGTTTESFTVDVDDCGEPGTLDTFGIQTTTYANGPSPLVGGNIQIHR